eukprot:TRINITY_DN162_c5_g1_i2.p1 TRINITY_DN162_c5_g1~~TRINITY_DN162_c5_g1_i2.p1  ORF type:complete len:673 (-),score=102.28 TRINITY_DN162_c5_g1_i2:111-2129(-)
MLSRSRFELKNSLEENSFALRRRALFNSLVFWGGWTVIVLVFEVHLVLWRIIIYGTIGLLVNYTLLVKGYISPQNSRFYEYLVTYAATAVFLLYTGGLYSDGLCSLVVMPFFVLQSKRELWLFFQVNFLNFATYIAFFIADEMDIEFEVIDMGIPRNVMSLLVLTTSSFRVGQVIFLFNSVAEEQTVQMQEIATDALKSFEMADKRDKMKHQFIGTLSHEVRTPLNSMFAAFQLFQDIHLPREARKLLKICQTSADHLLAVVNSILDALSVVSGVELNATTFPVHIFLQDLAAAFHVDAMEKNKLFEGDFEKEIPRYLVGDQTRIRQIIQNLMNNAFRFTPDGCKVQLKVKAISSPLPEGGSGSNSSPRPLSSGHEDDDFEEDVWLRFIVQDSGIGISSDHIDLIFDSFYQVDPGRDSKGGTGLGLGIVLNLVKLHNGRINVESEIGKGSSFIVDLPFTVASASDVRRKSKTLFLRNSSSSSSSSSLLSSPPSIIYSERKRRNKSECQTYSPRKNETMRILIVDDNKLNQKLLKMLLAKVGCTDVQLASSGAEALALLPLSKFDIMFLDLFMPEMDGIECARLTKKIAPSLFICCVSASISTTLQPDCFKAGMEDFISKPVFKSELVRVLTRLGDTLQREKNGSLLHSSFLLLSVVWFSFSSLTRPTARYFL